MNTAIAMPSPIDLIRTTSARPKPKKTTNMIAAAPVTSRPLFSRPVATEWRLLPGGGKFSFFPLITQAPYSIQKPQKIEKTKTQPAGTDRPRGGISGGGAGHARQ